uniref:Uncharacterized protein n=2 Tax=Picea TaxID=3328 RepID=A0A101M5M1_PICGL|nr:hypothetical protein ABT39_MTgene1102 [Picea glauca]QHR89964.1 hypothetical protein Q903MT_gene3986 [Picea sitchensis]
MYQVWVATYQGCANEFGNNRSANVRTYFDCSLHQCASTYRSWHLAHMSVWLFNSMRRSRMGEPFILHRLWTVKCHAAIYGDSTQVMVWTHPFHLKISHGKSHTSPGLVRVRS